MNPNEEIFKLIANGNFDRDVVFDEFKGLGETIDKTGKNFHEKRLENYQQFFTPYPVVRFITEALNLHQIENAVVFDNSAGIGRMFRYLHPSTRIIGIEKEENAYKVAKALFPKANIIKDDLINHVLPRGSVDFSIVNPPFSIRLEKRDSRINNAQWGKMGPRSSVESHIAALEIALKAARFYVAAVLPTTFFKNENTRIFEKWIKDRAKEVLRVDLPADAHAGAMWPTTLVIYDCQTYHYYPDERPHWSVLKLADLVQLFHDWRKSEYYQRFVTELADSIREYPTKDLHLDTYTTIDVSTLKTVKPRIPITGNKIVNVCINATNSELHLKAYDLITALKVQEYKDSLGERYNNATKQYVSNWWVEARRPESLYYSPIGLNAATELKHVGCDVKIDGQIENIRLKLRRWKELQLTPFEQFVQTETGTWELKNQNGGIMAEYPELYKQKEKKLEYIMKKHPKLELWDFQKRDVIRLSMKQHGILASDMGLGKTRMIIAIGCMHDCKHSLIVTEAKLIGQFAGELQQFGIPFKIIEKYSDTKNLKQFNLIAYSKIWRKATKGKTFAKALKKQVNFVALDEAHNIKANDSKRALACRSMNPTHWILSSGTPISNYPRNIFSLLVCAFGDGSELHPYGYWTPYIDGVYSCTSGTRQFREDFVTVSSYVSNQFCDTLDKGKRIREFPIIKDIEKWHTLLAPMMVRRCQNEPEVTTSVKIPEPKIEEVYVIPSKDHIIYYKLWLEAFAQWYLSEREKELNDSDHRMDMILLLLQIQKLQFVSTIPQSKKVQSDKQIGYNWTNGITKKQEKVMELAIKHIHQGEKTIVYSERPELLKLLAGEFRKKGIKGGLFTGEQSISKRDKILTEFKVNGMPLLLATTSCGGVGLNLYQASTIIFADQNYSPKIEEQAIHRILRPQQKKQPIVYKVYNDGFIDIYLKQMQDVKREGIDQGIDHTKCEFDPSQWMNFRDWTWKFLKEQGYV